MRKGTRIISPSFVYLLESVNMLVSVSMVQLVNGSGRGSIHTISLNKSRNKKAKMYCNKW